MKKITRDNYFKAKGLFHLANEHFLKAKEFETALNQLLEYGDPDYMGHISDCVFDVNPDFEAALKKEGFSIERTTPKKSPD